MENEMNVNKDIVPNAILNKTIQKWEHSKTQIQIFIHRNFTSSNPQYK